MFFIFNKQKIYSYVIALGTVSMLFFTATILLKEDVETIETVSINNETNITNEIQNKINE